MFKNAKKVLKEDLFLKDKYKALTNRNNISSENNENNFSFVSDLQIEKLFTAIELEKTNNFYIKQKEFEDKVRLEFVDLIYAAFIMFLLPLISSIFIYKDFFVANGVTGSIAYAGSFGAFFISGAIYVFLSSGIYEKISGGKTLKDIKKIRGFKAYCSYLRKNEKIADLFRTILNQQALMSDSYRQKTLQDKNDPRTFYDQISPSEFSYQEKKLIKALLDDLQNEIAEKY